MEGLFGTQKEHYNLRRVQARTKRTEILYIFSASTRHTWSSCRTGQNKGRVWRLPDTETCGQCGALVGELYPRHEKQTNNPAETTGNRYKIEIMMSRTQKLKGLSAAQLRLETLNDNLYLVLLSSTKFMNCPVKTYRSSRQQSSWEYTRTQTSAIR